MNPDSPMQAERNICVGIVTVSDIGLLGLTHRASGHHEGDQPLEKGNRLVSELSLRNHGCDPSNSDVVFHEEG